MRYATFIGTIEEVAGIPPEQAERAAQATLRTLSERISGGEARDIAIFLPKELRPYITSAPEPAEAFDRNEFMRRVAERERVDVATAAEQARAVFVALGIAVAPGELRDMAAQLPKDFDDLLEAAGVGRERAMRDDTMLDEGVIDRVAELAGLDRDQARRATEAVLETLAVRISNGEAKDLEAELPAGLVPAVERGLAESTAAKPMSLDEFVVRVAEREGVSADEAKQHARAVFAALRGVLSAKEFSDMAAQLPKDYATLLATPAELLT